DKVGGASAYLVTAALATRLMGPTGGIAAGSALAGFQSYEETYLAAKAKGASEEQAHNAAGISGLANAGLMSVPVSQWLMGVPQYFENVMLRYAGALAVHGITFPSVMAAQKALDNVIARTTYDPQRSLTEGLPTGMKDLPGLGEDAMVGIVLGVPGMIRHGV